MRILLLSQYFAPEVTAATARLLPLASGLAARGHEVEVVCELPNHPEGVVHADYRGRLAQRRRMEGFEARYVWVRTSSRKTSRTRILLYGSFALSGLVAALLARRPDVIVVSSPPLPAAAAAMAAATLRRVPWVMDVRDPWPEAAVAVGELAEGPVVRALENLERRLYGSATRIITVTEPFRRAIESKLNASDRVSVIPNGTSEAWLNAGEADVDRRELGMPKDCFVLTYAGNVGLAQGLATAVQAAGQLDDGFQLQIVGSGPELADVKERAAGLPVGRVAFRGVVPPNMAARYLRASDATLVPLRAAPELSQFVPSKLYDCCAIGRPVVLAAAGEVVRLAAGFGAALAIEPECPDALAEAVRRLRDDAALRERLSENGRKLARRYRREAGVDDLEGILRSVVAEHR